MKTSLLDRCLKVLVIWGACVLTGIVFGSLIDRIAWELSHDYIHAVDEFKNRIRALGGGMGGWIAFSAVAGHREPLRWKQLAWIIGISATLVLVLWIVMSAVVWYVSGNSASQGLASPRRLRMTHSITAPAIVAYLFGGVVSAVLSWRCRIGEAPGKTRSVPCGKIAPQSVVSDEADID